MQHRTASAGDGLSREARDTLFLLLVLTWTLLPQSPHVPAWCAALATAALAWRAWLAWHGGALPSRWWLTAALAGAVSLTLHSHGSLLTQEAGLTLLVSLAALKTLELRARRDAMVVFFLGFILVLAGLLRSASLLTALAMALSVLGLLTGLTLAHMPGGRPPLRMAAAVVLRQGLRGLPLVLLLYLFFPRLPPLWGLPGTGLGRTGLSEQLALGQVAELATDDRVAMRLRFRAAPPPDAQLYLRGPVLRRYDGQRWQVEEVAEVMPPRASSASATSAADDAGSWHYELEIESPRPGPLPLLELTAERPRPAARPGAGGGTGAVLVAPTLVRHEDGSWQLLRAAPGPLHLDARARPGSAAPVGLLGPVRASDLALPAPAHPRTRAWAQALARSPALAGTDGALRAARLHHALLAHIASAGYQYTLVPGEPGRGADADALDRFWLDDRRGFCEHYAVAMVVVMRSLGVPARLVTGYQGGQYDPITRVLEVRHSHAHAWLEYWLPGMGWVRADPTAAVAPERVSLGRRLRPPPGLVEDALTRVDPALFARLQHWWAALDQGWRTWALQDGRHRQLDWLRSLGWEQPDLLAALRALMAGLGALGIAGALLATQAAKRRRPDAWTRALRSVQAALERRGLAEARHLPPRGLAAAVQQRWGEAAQPLALALLACDRERYGAPPDGGFILRWRADRHRRQALRRGLHALPRPDHRG